MAGIPTGFGAIPSELGAENLLESGDSILIIREDETLAGDRKRWSYAARFILVGLFAGVALCWASALRPVPAAQGTQASDTSGTIVFSSPGTGQSQMLYLVDTKTQAFAVYRIDPQNPKGTVKLEAARQYRWDLKLAEFNNQPPDVASIESMVSSPRK